LLAALPLFATGLGAMGLFGWRNGNNTTCGEFPLATEVVSYACNNRNTQRSCCHSDVCSKRSACGRYRVHILIAALPPLAKAKANISTIEKATAILTC